MPYQLLMLKMNRKETAFLVPQINLIVIVYLVGFFFFCILEPLSETRRMTVYYTFKSYNWCEFATMLQQQF